MKKYTIVFIALLFAVACSVKKSTPKTEISSREIETKTTTTKTTTSLTDEEITHINDGKNLYNQKCGSCHELYNPSSKTKEQWTKIVPDMAKRSQETYNKISFKEEQYILKYLHQSASK